MESLRDRTKRLEGWKLKRYRCMAGHWTIGSGWNLDANMPPKHISEHLRSTGEITEDMAEELLTISLETATDQCKSIWSNFSVYSERRQMALIDMTFNLGAGGVMKFKKALAAIENRDWEEAAKQIEDSRYYEQVPNRAKENIEMIRNG